MALFRCRIHRSPAADSVPGVGINLLPRKQQVRYTSVTRSRRLRERRPPLMVHDAWGHAVVGGQQLHDRRVAPFCRHQE